MAKATKSTKSLTDDWIKQVVTGQRHKLAHMADGGSVETDEPTPVGFARYLMRGAQLLPQPAPVMPEIRQRMFPAPTAVAAPAELAQEALPAQEAIPASAPVVSPVGAQQSPVFQYATGGTNKIDKALQEAGAYANGGCVKKLSSGGDVAGPGTGTSDSIPAMLSDGEYVLPADTVDAVGKATLDKLKAATHTPTKKPSMKGMVMMRADGGVAQYLNPARYAPKTTAPDPDQEDKNAANGAKLNAESIQGLHNEAGIGSDFSKPQAADTSGYFAISHNLPAIAAPAPAPVAPLAPVVAAPVAAPATPEKVVAPDFMPTMTGPNTAQDMVSEGRNLMNTQGIGGFVQAKGLNRMAQTVNQTNAPLISGQFDLQHAAMTANERLEQAKLAEHQRQQNLETWTPDKNMMGELVGYGRTKGGVPQYVTKESLMAKPTLAQFLAKARPVNPKATDAELTAHYNATYAPE